MIDLRNGDCLELMKDIPDGSVDMILCDLPYGTTACKWDSVIPFEPLWEQYRRIIKPHGAICLFGNEPFTSELIHSNLKGFKYRWDWNKRRPSGMTYARWRPMQQTEDICVFTKNGEKTVYNPQMIKREKPVKGRVCKDTELYGGKRTGYSATYEYKNPVTLIEFLKVGQGAVHPTQKPVDLLEYLIKTYTNPGETVLDNCMGSGSTGVACVNTGRSFIGMELNEEYFKIATERIFAEQEGVAVSG